MLCHCVIRDRYVGRAVKPGKLQVVSEPFQACHFQMPVSKKLDLERARPPGKGAFCQHNLEVETDGL